MYIYVDNNVLISHEEGKRKLPILPQLQYVYSYVHLQEMLELGDRLVEKKDNRIETITNLTNGKIVCNNIDNTKVVLDEANPLNIYYCLYNPYSQILSIRIHENLSNWPMDNYPRILIDKLGIDKKIINNYSPEQILEKYRFLINDYLKLTCQYRQEEFQSFFNILDMLGYWQDNRGKAMGRSYDANHAYFSTFCNYFVTDDRNTRNKTNVLFHYWGYKTRAISYNEFIEIVHS